MALALCFAALAYLLAALERAPLTGLVALGFALLGVFVQPDAHATLALALGLAALGLITGRVAGPRWSWPWYAAAALAGAWTALLGHESPGFEALALLALAVVAYALAALESRPDLLPVALGLGVAALAAAGGALGWAPWARVLSFTGLGWLYALGEVLWSSLPGLRRRSGAWWVALRGATRIETPAARAAEQGTTGDAAQAGEPYALGVLLHRGVGVLVAGAGTLVALSMPGAFVPGTAETQGGVAALLAFAGLLVFEAWRARWHILRYVAGGLVALAVTWEARWLGAQNVQAFVLAPGSYLLLIGALLPADARLGRQRGAGQLTALAGSLLLLLPTLGQSLTSGADQSWWYVLTLTCEALLIAGYGVGTRSRLLVLLGAGFVGLAGLRAAVLALNSGVPVALVIALIALLLMGGATWLSLRRRREAELRP